MQYYMCKILLEETPARKNGEGAKKVEEPSNLNGCLHPSEGERLKVG